MKNVAEKIQEAGNERVMLTERGTFFGYNRLVNDMTAIDLMKRLGHPVVFDATHSTQLPGGLGVAKRRSARDGAPFWRERPSRPGASGLFLEVHPEPEKAQFRRHLDPALGLAGGCAYDVQTHL